ISDPENPQELGFAPSLEGNGSEVLLNGPVAYMTHGKYGVFVYDVSDPYDPVKITEYDTLGSAEKAVIRDGLIYVADMEGGLLVLETLSSKGLDDLPYRLPNSPGLQRRSQRSEARDQTGTGSGEPGTTQISRHSGSGLERPRPISYREDFRSLSPWEARIRSPQTRSEQANKASNQVARPAITGARAQANTCQVNTTADSGSGSLRWCMNQAQSGDTIVFDSAIFPPHDPATILLSSELPQITQGGLTIDASESGVILDGQDLDIAGINIGSDANTIRGLQIHHCGGSGILVLGDWNVIGGDRSIGSGPAGQGNVLSANGGGFSIWEGSHNIITGNLVGTDVTGRFANGNEDQGIAIRGGHNNLIGGYKPGERNIVSANGGPGISLGPSIGGKESSYENRIIGNYVGTDIDGGVALGNGETGIVLGAGPFGNLIEGNVCSGNSGTGINVGDPGTSYNTVVGNIVGLDASGTWALGNASGIAVGDSPPGFNRVGGSLQEDRNIVSGNQGDGILIAGDDYFVLGNYVGTDVTGTQAIGNNTGVFIGQAVHSFVGGTRREERNVISGNSNYGMMVVVSFNNLVLGNYIGVDSSGASALPNQEAVNIEGASRNILQRNVISGNEGGVRIWNDSEHNLLRANRLGVAAEDSLPIPNQWQGIRIESASNQIGGPYPEDGNVIAHNEGGGVEVWTHPGNSILGNSIYGNNGLGIYLEDDGNNSLAAPQITRASPISIQGTTCAGCRVDVFSDEGQQGRVFEGSTLADAAGSFEISFATWLHGPNITCTATDLQGNTSPFSSPAAISFYRRGGRRVPQ
ncbi:MAG: hypothetical protein GY906_26275, partial [bacterium]|nr:hypothetical protein [bacterium]